VLGIVRKMRKGKRSRKSVGKLPKAVSLDMEWWRFDVASILTLMRGAGILAWVEGIRYP
jgi:hypothetical protein